MFFTITDKHFCPSSNIFQHINRSHLASCLTVSSLLKNCIRFAATVDNLMIANWSYPHIFKLQYKPITCFRHNVLPWKHLIIVLPSEIGIFVKWPVPWMLDLDENNALSPTRRKVVSHALCCHRISFPLPNL